VLLVDDQAAKLERNYGNHVPIAPYTGAPSDPELPALAQYLIRIAGEPDLQSIEKRGWRRAAGLDESA
jgi:hypothetical protein